SPSPPKRPTRSSGSEGSRGRARLLARKPNRRSSPTSSFQGTGSPSEVGFLDPIPAYRRTKHPQVGTQNRKPVRSQKLQSRSLRKGAATSGAASLGSHAHTGTQEQQQPGDDRDDAREN